MASTFDPAALTRPDPALLRHYLIVSLFGLIFFPIIFLPLYFKYRTLEYAFDDEGVSMSWGVLFRREIYLTYRRLQDIQMTRGVIQRRLGLADLHLHTASGSAGAEMRIEGITRPEALRDFLYARMRGSEGEDAPVPGDPPRGDAPGAPPLRDAPGPPATRPAGPSSSPIPSATASPAADEALRLLAEIRDELRRLASEEGPRS